MLLKYVYLDLEIDFFNMMVVVFFADKYGHTLHFSDRDEIFVSLIYLIIYQCSALLLPLILSFLSILLHNPPLIIRSLLIPIKISLLVKNNFLCGTSYLVIFYELDTIFNKTAYFR